MDSQLQVKVSHDKILQSMFLLNHIYKSENSANLFSSPKDLEWDPTTEIVIIFKAVLKLVFDYSFKRQIINIKDNLATLNILKPQLFRKQNQSRKFILERSFYIIYLLEMSSKEASVTNSASKSQHNYRKLRKFKFSDLSLSYQVRKKLYEMLISFDDNVNYEFEKQQIKKALIEILQESQSEIAYVINNVFRYDVNRDGVVTYQQFSNFCLEQHFGEMAIQRLHKTDLYHRGKERVMERRQFYKTLQYCLSFISVKPSIDILKSIFNDVDLDRDQYITYADYFTFLKEYFGSQSQSASIVTVQKVQQDLKKVYGNTDRNTMKMDIFKQKKARIDENKNANKPIPKPVVVPDKKVQQNKITSSAAKTQQLQNLGQRISRLIYHQLKITAMQHDRQMLLCSDELVAQQLLIGVIRISQYKAKQIISEAFQKQQTISYEKLLKYAVQKFMCEDVIDNTLYPLNKQKYVSTIISNLYFVRAKPFAFLLEQLFDRYADGNSKVELNKAQFKQLIGLIFNSYKWPRKTGELRKKQPLIPKIQNRHIARY